MKIKSYIQLQKKYGGKFIAKAEKEVIASARTSKLLWNKVRNRIGTGKILIEYIEPKGTICIYGIFYR